MSLYNVERKMISPFTTTNNFYLKKDQNDSEIDFDKKTVKRNPSQKLALKFEKIELEDNIEKQKLYELKLNSLTQKFNRIEQERIRSATLYNKRTLNTNNEIMSLKTEIQDFQKQIEAKERNILNLQTNVEKQKSLLHNLSKIENQDKENSLKEDYTNKQNLLKNITETNFNTINHLNDLNKQFDNLNIDIENINQELEKERYLIKDGLEKKNIFQTAIRGQIEINKMNDKQNEEVLKTYKDKNDDLKVTNNQITFYKKKLKEKKKDIKTFIQLEEEESCKNTKIVKEISLRKEKENEMKRNIQILSAECNKIENKILDLKQNLMEKTFSLTQNEEEINYSKEFLEALHKVAEKNIQTLSEFIADNNNIVQNSMNVNSMDFTVNQVKKDLKDLHKLI